MAPAKCGTRHLSELWLPKIYKHSDHLPEVNYVIIRPPLDLLISALSTDAYLYTNELNGKLDFTVLLNSFINNSKRNVHWCSDIYETIYHYCEKRPNVEIIELKNLSQLLIKLGKEKTYINQKYVFPYYNMLKRDMNTKDKLFEYVKENNQKEVSILMDIVDKQNIIYNQIKK